MDRRGNTFPLIPYNLIIDTDVGLYQLIRDKYRDESVFATGVLDMPVKVMKYFLLKRAQVNPLETIALLTTDEEKAKMDEYYNQFMEREIDYIMENSPLTALYDFIVQNHTDRNINITIWCPTEHIKEFFTSRAPSIFAEVKFRVTDTFEDCIEDNDSPIYIKDLKQAAINFEKYYGKAIYLANYEFNYDINPVTKKKGLNADAGIIFDHRASILLYEPYRQEDLQVIN